MKKLIMAVAIVCAAALTNGATIDWKSSKMYLQNGDATSAAGDITGYLFLINGSTYQAYIDGGFTANGTKLSDQIWKDYGSQIASATPYDAPKSGKLTISSEDMADGTYYAAIIYTDNVTDGGDKYYMGNIASVKIENGLDAGVSDLGSTIFGDAGTVATAWSAEAVPEPFSGTLALLGVGVLALRRKMKKSKKA